MFLSYEINNESQVKTPDPSLTHKGYMTSFLDSLHMVFYYLPTDNLGAQMNLMVLVSNNNMYIDIKP